MKNSQRGTCLCLEPLEERCLLSAASDVAMTFATTTDSRTLSINYTITGASLAGQDLSFNVYRSAAYQSLSGAQLIGSAVIPGADSTDLGVGAHQGVRLSLTAPNGQPLTALTPNPALPFIVIVANPSGTIAESDTSNNIASFETHVLGVVAHGLEIDPLLWIQNIPPAWEMQLAAVLQQQDGYEAVLPFNWVRLSILPFPLAIELAGSQLYQLVVAQADQLASQHPGDVVDINFIGHSRGTVVISEVLQQLVGSNDPALRGGYMEMTLLDPHPANLQISRFSWVSAIPDSNTLAALIAVFDILTHDPQVVVPANVQQTQLFDEQTMAGQLGFSDPTEILLNLWGQTPGAIVNHSAQAIQSRNLTNVVATGIGLIGHTEVHEWYINNVADANKTFTYFG
jgi:hypothetical protein